LCRLSLAHLLVVCINGLWGNRTRWGVSTTVRTSQFDQHKIVPRRLLHNLHYGNDCARNTSLISHLPYECPEILRGVYGFPRYLIFSSVNSVLTASNKEMSTESKRPRGIGYQLNPRNSPVSSFKLFRLLGMLIGIARKQRYRDRTHWGISTTNRIALLQRMTIYSA
jgi:hypothetical protein